MSLIVVMCDVITKIKVSNICTCDSITSSLGARHAHVLLPAQKRLIHSLLGT